MDKRIVSYFSNGGVPQGGLSPIIYIFNITTDTMMVSGGSMTPKGIAPCLFYDFIFTSYNPEHDYFILVDGGASLEPYERYQPGINNFNSISELSDELDESSGSIN